VFAGPFVPPDAQLFDDHRAHIARLAPDVARFYEATVATLIATVDRGHVAFAEAMVSAEATAPTH